MDTTADFDVDDDDYMEVDDPDVIMNEVDPDVDMDEAEPDCTVSAPAPFFPPGLFAAAYERSLIPDIQPPRKRW